jgi:hypothetical protein
MLACPNLSVLRSGKKLKSSWAMIEPIYNWPREEVNPAPPQSYFEELIKKGWQLIPGESEVFKE